MATATNMSGDVWEVSTDDGRLVQISMHPGATEAEAIAAVTGEAAQGSTLDSDKTSAVRRVIGSCNAKAAQLGGYLEIEPLTFDLQEFAARDYQEHLTAASASSIAVLDAIRVGGEDRAAIAATILANADTFRALALALIKLRRQYVTTINAATTATGVAAAVADFNTDLAALG